MFDFELDEHDFKPLPEIEITEADVRAALIVKDDSFELTLDDLAQAGKSFAASKAQFLTITLADIRRAQPQMIEIGLADLPPIIEITLADLRGDLTNRATDCFHGTSLEAAKKIQREGFCVGHGNALGSGIYFSVGGITIAKSYAKSAKPCIVHASVHWGKVAYLDDKNLPAGIRGSGDGPTKAALKVGYHSFITTEKYSSKQPAVGIILATQGQYVKPPRIEVIELLDPQGKRIG